MLKNVHETQWQDMHPAWQEVHAHKHGNQHGLLISNTPATLFHMKHSCYPCSHTVVLFTSKVASPKHVRLFLPTYLQSLQDVCRQMLQLCAHVQALEDMQAD